MEVRGREDVCSVDLSAFSCQTDNFESPDTITRDGLLERGRKLLVERGGCINDESELVLNANTSLIGTDKHEYSAEELVNSGKASNCYRAGNDTLAITHRAYAKCSPQEAMIDRQGNYVKNTNMAIKSDLTTCDMGEVRCRS